MEDSAKPAASTVVERAASRLGRLALRADALWLRMTGGATLARRVEAVPGDPDDWSFLRRPALLGFVAVLAICLGASLPSSPFKLEGSQGGSWFFGETAWPTDALMLQGVVAVYGGMVLFVRVWWGLYRTLRSRPAVPIRQLCYMLAVWMAPLLVVAPLFSRDVFSYAAQGELMSHAINPYHYGPGTIGSGPYVSGVDPLWANTPAPYGPLFLILAGWSATLTLHHALLTIELLRLQSVVGVALMAYCIPKLARSFGHDPGPAFVLAVLNPLTLLALVGGAHNDAIMVGLLLAGITAARSLHPVWGVVLCALAASIKVPAAIGIVYVAWDWAG
ncbi:MAG TPA: polyprenol phosphomannose-dependent alpha 1,6 mannosyltransferase MptB, partial [Acidimicrobiales bacterium]|nr:polyprenol phosphomannose-dependent alpha 1,6 mannosyltransferase MptB [Acidimicrobiales bacterium]